MDGNGQEIIPLYEVDEDGKVKVNVPQFLSERERYSKYTEEQKAEILEIAFGVMEDGNSLDLVCTQLGVSAASILKWIGGNPELEDRYERQKKIRARGMIETVLGKIQTAQTYQEARIADIYARHALKIAALLRPNEFSDKKERGGGGDGQAVTFTLNFNHGDGEQVRVTTDKHTNSG